MTLAAIQIALWVAGLAALAVSAGFDLRQRIIPNAMAVLVAAIGLALGLLSAPAQIWIGVLVAVAVLFGLGILSHFNLMGGGDVKLISAATLMVPPLHVAGLLVDIFLIGGLLGLCYGLVYRILKNLPQPAYVPARSGPGRGLRRLAKLERRRILQTKSMPFGVAVLAGVGVHVISEWVTCSSAIFCSL